MAMVAARWEAIRDLTARTEAAVAANADTPCALEVLALLTCARAHVYLGDDVEAKRLERAAAALGKEGFTMGRGVEAQMAIARGELSKVEQILDTWKPQGLDDVEGVVSRLDALVALGRRAEIEAEVPALVIPGSYLEPFALRALGWARGDEDMIRRAIARFEEMDLTWHADQARRSMGRA
jgi:hypothetical protein